MKPIERGLPPTGFIIRLPATAVFAESVQRGPVGELVHRPSKRRIVGCLRFDVELLFGHPRPLLEPAFVSWLVVWWKPRV